MKNYKFLNSQASFFTENEKRKRITFFLGIHILFVFVTITLCIGFLIPVNATNYTYADNVPTPKYATNESPGITGLKGARARSDHQTPTLFLHVNTFKPNPGYKLIASGANPSTFGWVTVSHSAVSSIAYSSCYWSYELSYDPLVMTCQYTK